MIRREFATSDGTRLWLLISQVEHAHVSGELTRHWKQRFSPDVIDAITHHDDGWAAWEAEAKLNPALGAPFSFLEMPLPAALVIWDHSIQAAAAYGPLASYLVAGHFYRLLSDSEMANDPLAVAWLTSKRKLRTTWLDQWIRSDPSHSLDDAKSAQQMLLLADLFSLWLCCETPLDGAHDKILTQSSMKLQTGLLDQFHFTVPDFQSVRNTGEHPVDLLRWDIAVNPFPGTTEPLPLSARAIAAPALRYDNWQQLKDASWPVDLEWQLHA